MLLLVNHGANLKWEVKSSCVGVVSERALPVGRTTDNDVLCAARCKVEVQGVAVDVVGIVSYSTPKVAWYALESDEFNCSDYELLSCG